MQKGTSFSTYKLLEYAYISWKVENLHTSNEVHLSMSSMKKINQKKETSEKMWQR